MALHQYTATVDTVDARNRICLAVHNAPDHLQVMWITHQAFDQRVRVGTTGIIKYQSGFGGMIWNFYPDTDWYFIIDDCIDQHGTEGYVVMFGDPYTAVGVERGKFKLFRQAVNEAARHIVKGENVYRVRLARRHGEHKVTILAMPIPVRNGFVAYPEQSA